MSYRIQVLKLPSTCSGGLIDWYPALPPPPSPVGHCIMPSHSYVNTLDHTLGIGGAKSMLILSILAVVCCHHPCKSLFATVCSLMVG